MLSIFLVFAFLTASAVPVSAGDGTTPTKHIYAGDMVVATIEGTTLNYVHTDHLTGSNAVTNNNGGMVQLLDYYPYGSLRIDWKHASFDEQRKFAGHEFDRDTGLTYMVARYYDSGIGRFISQDSVFREIGNKKEIREKTKRDQEKLLEEPQLLNSYAYAGNNPLKHIDEKGEFIQIVYAAGLGFLAGIGSEYISDVIESRAIEGQHGLSSFLPREGFVGRAVTNGVEGGFVAGAFAINPLLGIGVTPAASIVTDIASAQQPNFKDAAIKTGTTAISAGLLQGVPKVPGRLPNFGTKAFFLGEHAQRAATEALVSGIVDVGAESFTKIELNKNSDKKKNDGK